MADGEVYRIVTSGFLHAGILHIGLNMYILYVLGTVLEPGIGSVRFAGLYIASLLGGSFGALLVEPHALTVGASGAVFGVMAATYLVARQRGLRRSSRSRSASSSSSTSSSRSRPAGSASAPTSAG